MKKSHFFIISIFFVFLQMSSCKKKIPLPEYKPPSLEKSKLFYSTFNSVRQIDVSNNEWTVHFESSNSSSIYGLNFIENQDKLWFTSSFPAGVWEIKPLYQHYQYNEFRSVFNSSLSTPSDVETDKTTGATYVAANYSVYKSNGNIVNLLNSVNLVNQPFSLVVAKNHLIVAGVSQVSITNLGNMNTALFGNPNIGMAGFMCLGGNNIIYITDPSNNSIKKLTENELDYAIQDLANNTTITSSFSQITSGNLLNETVNSSNIRGPIGIDVKGNSLYVTVDTGTNNPGRIVKIDILTGNQTIFKNNVPGPRDIIVY